MMDITASARGALTRLSAIIRITDTGWCTSRAIAVRPIRGPTSHGGMGCGDSAEVWTLLDEYPESERRPREACPET